VVLASTIGGYGGMTPGDAGYREDVPFPVASAHAIPAAKKIAETATAAQEEVDIVVARRCHLGTARPRGVTVLRRAPTRPRRRPRDRAQRRHHPAR
jgi:hypothetical protein